MIALTLGMIVVAALVIVFSNASATRHEVDRTSRQVENGHYAMQVLADDVRHAGYFAEFKPDVLATPAAKPDPCATAITDLKTALRQTVAGMERPATSSVKRGGGRKTTAGNDNDR